jgi:hypothetical protein
MLWLATIEPLRRSPRGDVVVAAGNWCGRLSYSRNHGPGRWRR